MILIILLHWEVNVPYQAGLRVGTESILLCIYYCKYPCPLSNKLSLSLLSLSLCNLIWPHSTITFMSEWRQKWNHSNLKVVSKYQNMTSKWRLRTTSFFLWINYKACKRHFHVIVWYFFDTIFKLWSQFDLILASFWHQYEGKSKFFWWQNDVTWQCHLDINRWHQDDVIISKSKWCRMWTSFWCHCLIFLWHYFDLSLISF